MIKFIRSLFSRPKSTLIRFELLVKPSFVEKLEQLAEDFGTSKAVVIDCAIGLFAKALEEAEKGNIIDFVPDNPTTTKIDWRTLCAELLENLESLTEGDRRPEPENWIRVRDALAQTEEN